MKTKITLVLIVLIALTGSLVISCSSNRSVLVDAKTGVQLWGENCIRCHNIPSPAAFNDHDWSAIEMHMKVRANLTKVETERIFKFIKSAN